MGPDAVAIFVGAGLVTRSADTEFPFRQDSDFWYLTGFDHPDAVAVLSTRPDDADYTLFVQAKDATAEIWTGYRPGTEGAVADYGADEAFESGKLLDKLPVLLRGAERIYHRLGCSAELDARIVSLQDEIRRQSRGGILPASELIDPRALVHEMRLVKSAEEIAIMQRAADISLEAHGAAARLAHSGHFEYELEAELGRVFRARGGAGPAYTTIVGGGVNATCLHYIRNDQPLRDGDVVLIDAGVEYQGYASDVTRTYPVGGRFTPAARDVYNIVLEAQLASIAASKPGATLPDVHAASVRVLTEGLRTLGLLKGNTDTLIETEAFKPYYMHGTSHWLGLDVHDVGAYVTRPASPQRAAGKPPSAALSSSSASNPAREPAKPRPLVPGMAFTIEPGLYIAANDENAPAELRGLGIRIEDDVVIQEGELLNLNAAIPKRADDVEAWVRDELDL